MSSDKENESPDVRPVDVLDKGEIVQVLTAGYPTKGRKDFCNTELVRKNFISKTKVREVINKHTTLHLDSGKSIEDFAYRILKELGLE